MPILLRYISREFLKVFILSLSSFIAIYLVVDAFQGIRMIMEYSPALSLIAKLYLLKIPKIVSLTIPVAVLLSTLLTLGLLSRNSEITAMKSSGVSLYLIVTPILAISLLISALSFLSNEYVVPYTNMEARFTEKVGIRKKSMKTFFKQNKIWYRSEDAIYNIRLFDPDTNTMRGITIYSMGEGFGLLKRVEAREARWNGKGWRFYDCREDIFDNGTITTNRYKELEVKLPESPEALRAEEREAEEMGFWELRGYIKRLRNEGYDPLRFIVDLHSKVSSPFTSLIMALLGIPFALKGGRSSGLAFGVGVSVVVGFGYWLIMSFAISLGRVGALPPILAAWGANIVFGSVATIMIMKVEGD
jgi:lipopolysaccharide export system permease protein